MLGRGLLLLVTGIASSVAVGQRVARRRVQEKRADVVATVALEVRETIRRQARGIILTGCKAFARSALLKAGIVSVLLLLRLQDIITGEVFLTCVTVFLTLFLLRDLRRAYPSVRLGARELHAHGWQPRVALAEVVAAQVYSLVSAEADKEAMTRWQRIGLAFAGETRTSFNDQIAAGVAEAARQTTWHDLRPFLFWGAASFTLTMALYATFLATAFHLSNG